MGDSNPNLNVFYGGVTVVTILWQAGSLKATASKNEDELGSRRTTCRRIKGLHSGVEKLMI